MADTPLGGEGTPAQKRGKGGPKKKGATKDTRYRDDPEYRKRILAYGREYYRQSEEYRERRKQYQRQYIATRRPQRRAQWAKAYRKMQEKRAATLTPEQLEQLREKSRIKARQYYARNRKRANETRRRYRWKNHPDQYVYNALGKFAAGLIGVDELSRRIDWAIKQADEIFRGGSLCDLPGGEKPADD